MPVIAPKVERFVLLNGTADDSAELVLLQDLLSGLAGRIVAVIEEVVGVKRLVPDELEHATMHLVAARLCDHVHVRAGVPPKAGVIGGGLNLELLNRIRTGNGDPCI